MKLAVLVAVLVCSTLGLAGCAVLQGSKGPYTPNEVYRAFLSQGTRLQRVRAPSRGPHSPRASYLMKSSGTRQVVEARVAVYATKRGAINQQRALSQSFVVVERYANVIIVENASIHAPELSVISSVKRILRNEGRITVLDILVGLAGLALLIGGVTWLALRTLKRGDPELGGLTGRRPYRATITHRGRPVEHVRVSYPSRRQAERALKSMYGKRNVSNVRADEDAGPARG